MGRMLRRANLRHNDYVFGMQDTGRMNAERVVALVSQLPEGTSELYFHTAVQRSPETPWPAHYACEEELDALTSPAVAAALEASGVHPISFSDLSPARP